MRRILFLVVILGACSDSNDTPDARSPDAGPSAAVLRGKYLVSSVLACGDCHTPRLPTGAPDTTKLLSGVECFIDIAPPADNGTGCLNSRNLTNDVTGLKNRTDAQIKTMFQTGVRPDGSFLANFMPYYVFHALSDGDADAIVAYLRTVPAVSHTVPASQAPFDNILEAAPVVMDSEIPPAGGTGATHDSAVRGRYLAAVACMECHSPDTAPGSARPVDLAKAFQGGRDFPAAALGLPVPPFPEHIFSLNITPDATGIAGWAASDVVKMIKMGMDKDANALCPPMPFGPMGAFGGMTDVDAMDIANYIVSLDPQATTVPPKCIAP
jgi:mono/diheme cytochrome c family protein